MGRVLAGGRPSRTKEMDGLKLTRTQWESIVAAWDQDPSRRPVLSSGGEPMISSWRPETEMVHDVSHQPDLSAEEALNALEDLSSLLSSFEAHDAPFVIVIHVFSFLVHSGRIPIRRHQDTLLRSIYRCVPIKIEPADYDSPYFKIFLLLQAHFSRLPLSLELAADLTIVLERVFSLFSVCSHHVWSDSDVDVTRRSPMFSLMRMCVHGMWQDSPELQQIPHFVGGVSCSVKCQGLWLIHASGYWPFSYSRHPVCPSSRGHGCASTKPSPADGCWEDVRHRAA
jgi:hypothetical protein